VAPVEVPEVGEGTLERCAHSADDALNRHILFFNFFARTSRYISFLAMVHNSHSLSTDSF
jgi:hypothetical protein